MSTIDIEAFSFPLELSVGGKEGWEQVRRTLEQLDLEYQRFRDSYSSNDTQMLDAGVDAAGDGGYTVGAEITDEELAQLQLNLHAAPQKYHRGSVTLVDAFNLDLVHLVPAPAPTAKPEAVGPRSAITWPPFSTLGAHPEAYDANMGWSLLHPLAQVGTPFTQSAGSCSSSASPFFVYQQPTDTFSGGASPETPAPNNFTHHPAFISGETATHTQGQSAPSSAQEAASLGVPPSESHEQPTELRTGVPQAVDDPIAPGPRIQKLIDKGGLLPGQHDDWLGIVRKNICGVILHRHIAFEKQLPTDVQDKYERLRDAVYQHARFWVGGLPDPMSEYFSPKEGYYRCPICTEEIKYLAAFLRHVEGTNHLGIIYLCNHERGATTMQSCQFSCWRANNLNRHLKDVHGVHSGRKKDRRTLAKEAGRKSRRS
ncbi:unnamed protein product [Peniophora sp. CBMAI 1063]|nr:unnamed protein product [Peniophora sp. CBMAI 1063]